MRFLLPPVSGADRSPEQGEELMTSRPSGRRRTYGGHRPHNPLRAPSPADFWRFPGCRYYSACALGEFRAAGTSFCPCCNFASFSHFLRLTDEETRQLVCLNKSKVRIRPHLSPFSGRPGSFLVSSLTSPC